MKTVGIVILNYKNWEDTIECLYSIENIKYKDYKIFVVDNFSNNDSLDHISNWWSKKYNEPINNVVDEENVASNERKTFFLIQSQDNRGYASGNNIGIRFAIQQFCDYILILNPDTVVTDSFLEPMVNFLNQNNQVAMVGPKIMTTENNIDYVCARKRPLIWDYLIPTYIWRYFFKKGLKIDKYNPVLYPHHFYLEDKPKVVDIISGACMLIRSNLLTKISFLDEKTFLYLEELILHEKLRKGNFQTYFIPESIIVHKQGSSTSLDSWLFVRKEYLKSLHYYLSEYRNYSPLVVKLIISNVFIFQVFSYVKSYVKNLIKR